MSANGAPPAHIHAAPRAGTWQYSTPARAPAHTTPHRRRDRNVPHGGVPVRGTRPGAPEERSTSGRGLLSADRPSAYVPRGRWRAERCHTPQPAHHRLGAQVQTGTPHRRANHLPGPPGARPHKPRNGTSVLGHQSSTSTRPSPENQAIATHPPTACNHAEMEVAGFRPLPACPSGPAQSIIPPRPRDTATLASTGNEGGSRL